MPRCAYMRHRNDMPLRLDTGRLSRTRSMLNIMPTSDEKESGRETQITTILCTSQIGRLTALCKKTIFLPLARWNPVSGSVMHSNQWICEQKKLRFLNLARWNLVSGSVTGSMGRLGYCCYVFFTWRLVPRAITHSGLIMLSIELLAGMHA